jgi:hypothetical protein
LYLVLGALSFVSVTTSLEPGVRATGAKFKAQSSKHKAPTIRND